VRYVAAFPPRGVFVNYRREDAGPYARLVQVKLDQRFPNVPVFMDLDSIEAGADFAEAIKSGVDSCAVLVALIGPKWLTVTDEDARRRLDDPDDYVRYEIRTALEQGVRVIPVLVDGARAPKPQQLPDDLQRLARLNALEMSWARLDYDATRLTDAIQRVLDEEALAHRPLGTSVPARGSRDRNDRPVVSCRWSAYRTRSPSRRRAAR
jgi:TIR domain